ncbi:MAG: serine protease [Gammaproteobacteria bacterium]|nr:serine protease [Gammaproteobacteria bacterium]
MIDPKDWALPEKLRPRPEKTRFDLAAARHAVLMLHAEVPEDAFTAEVLGTERIGHGVVIAVEGREVVLTIGYLITEARAVWLTTHDGRAIEGHPLAYDQVTGIGLVLPLAPLRCPPLARCSAAGIALGDRVYVIGHGGLEHSLVARLIARREFAGYWEYLLDDALFTAPPHPLWGGTALLDEQGRLVGIGSLLTQEAGSSKESFDANMFVPIDLAEPVLGEMLRSGRPAAPPRPWLGLYAAEQDQHVIIAGLSRAAPAHRAGLQPGDVVIAVAGKRVASLPDFFRAVWGVGPAGSTVPLQLVRGREALRIDVPSASREDFLRKPRAH